ncbi:MAG: ferritin family protein [Candidatus Latescibacterota bacterium]|jgi:rubrerythrin
MKFHSEESVKALEYAAKKEQETEDFYRQILNKVKNPGVVAILKSLAEDENKHYKIVIKLLKETGEGKSPSIEMIESDAAKVRLERSFSESSISDPESIREDATRLEILKKGLGIEVESFDNYSRAAEKSEDDEVKAVFRFLAGEENKHYILIDNLISYLDVPSRWLYREENLIFQL